MPQTETPSIARFSGGAGLQLRWSPPLRLAAGSAAPEAPATSCAEPESASHDTVKASLIRKLPGEVEKNKIKEESGPSHPHRRGFSKLKQTDTTHGRCLFPLELCESRHCLISLIAHPSPSSTATLKSRRTGPPLIRAAVVSLSGVWDSPHACRPPGNLSPEAHGVTLTAHGLLPRHSLHSTLRSRARVTWAVRRTT